MMGLADFAFAMQGLGHGRDSLLERTQQKADWLPKIARARQFLPLL